MDGMLPEPANLIPRLPLLVEVLHPLKSYSSNILNHRHPRVHQSLLFRLDPKLIAPIARAFM